MLQYTPPFLLPIQMIGFMFTLSACVYHATPEGTYARIDLPIHQQTTIHKTVTVNAPAGTTVIMSEHVPVSAYGQTPTIHCRNSRHQSCYQRVLPPPRPVHRIQGQGGSVSQSRQGYFYSY